MAGHRQSLAAASLKLPALLLLWIFSLNCKSPMHLQAAANEICFVQSYHENFQELMHAVTVIFVKGGMPSRTSILQT